MKRYRIMLLSVVMILALLLTACSAGQPSGSDSDQNEPSGNGSSQSEPALSTNGNDPLDTNHTVPIVYFTSDISPEGLMAVYEALAWTPTGNVAVKLSTGEPPASNYLRPELIKDLVQSVNGTIVECNTTYGGSCLHRHALSGGKGSWIYRHCGFPDPR